MIDCITSLDGKIILPESCLINRSMLDKLEKDKNYNTKELEDLWNIPFFSQGLLKLPRGAKFRPTDYNKANEAMTVANKKFNAAQLGLTIEEFERRGLK